MRRGLASLLMGLSLVLASTGWAGLTLSSTVLDGQNSARLARQAMDDPMVRTVLVDRMSEGMARLLPDDEPMSRQELAAAADNALARPAASSVIDQAIVDAHQLGLSGIEVDGFFAHFDSNEAARLALVQERPALNGQILVNPLVRIVLPTEGLTWLSGLKLLVDRFAVAALSVGLVGFAAAFVVARDATATMRRASWWILGAAAFWTLSAIGFGTAARAAAPSSYVLLVSTIESFFSAMRVPTIVMTSFGLGLLAVSAVVPALERRRGGYLLSRSRGSSPGDLSSVTTNSADRAKAAGGRGLSAAWMEGHGYLDDARVAPFLHQTADTVGRAGRERINSNTE